MLADATAEAQRTEPASMRKPMSCWCHGRLPLVAWGARTASGPGCVAHSRSVPRLASPRSHSPTPGGMADPCWRHLPLRSACARIGHSTPLTIQVRDGDRAGCSGVHSRLRTASRVSLGLVGVPSRHSTGEQRRQAGKDRAYRAFGGHWSADRGAAVSVVGVS